MELKDYQRETLETLSRWLQELEKAKRDSRKLIDFLTKQSILSTDDHSNYPKTAWRRLQEGGYLPRAAGDHATRTNELGLHVPHACLKIPTGGGKTLLGAAAVERLIENPRLILWITPTRTIYEQTKKAFWSREHPYRQLLERASGGRVKVLEKDDPITLSDTEHFSCFMLLMLPAANRTRSRDFLRIFRDSNLYPSFFPEDDDLFGGARLLQEFPDLDRSSENGPIRQSLFNVMKMLRPVVILDEAHKAYGSRNSESNEQFASTISRLNPRLVLELSATPNAGISNLLADVSGTDLKFEEMIKLPVQVTSFTNSQWQYTLGQAQEELERLTAESELFGQQVGRYIRPIGIIRVERTGRTQRDGFRIHAEDVREYLIQNLGVAKSEVAVKTSECDELADIDLLSEYSAVRWIVTKDALKEGWDCPFAYLLVMLDNTQAQTALTQLVGRIMRQPDASRTGNESLDRCYVYCFNTDVGTAVKQVKQGLEKEGLSGLDQDVFAENINGNERITISRREPFQGQTIFLPKVLHKNVSSWVELDYQQHILPSINWNDLSGPRTIQGSFLERPERQIGTVDTEDLPTIYFPSQEVFVDKTFLVSWYARRLGDVVTNPWQAARIVFESIETLRTEGFTDEDIYDQRYHLSFAIRQHAQDELEKLAEYQFTKKLQEGEIRFDLDGDNSNFKMKETYDIPMPPGDLFGLFPGNDGRQIQLSLFEPVYANSFDSNLERSFARYIDEQKAIQWWHRVAVKQKGDFYIRGWKQDRIWPDFLAMADRTSGGTQLFILETKGEHLEHLPDTDYKKRVFGALERAFNAGSLNVRDGVVKGTFRLLFDKRDFSSALSSLSEY